MSRRGLSSVIAVLSGLQSKLLRVWRLRGLGVWDPSPCLAKPNEADPGVGFLGRDLCK